MLTEPTPGLPYIAAPGGGRRGAAGGAGGGESGVRADRGRRLPVVAERFAAARQPAAERAQRSGLTSTSGCRRGSRGRARPGRPSRGPAGPARPIGFGRTGERSAKVPRGVPSPWPGTCTSRSRRERWSQMSTSSVSKPRCRRAPVPGGSSSSGTRAVGLALVGQSSRVAHGVRARPMKVRPASALSGRSVATSRGRIGWTSVVIGIPSGPSASGAKTAATASAPASGARRSLPPR